MKRSRKIRIIIIVLSVLLGASLFALAETYSRARLSGEAGDTAVVEDNYIKSSATGHIARLLNSYVSGAAAYGASYDIKLNGEGDSDAEPFKASNMLPGDEVTKKFTVKATYSGSTKLCFAATVQDDEGSKKLAEVMKLKVQVDSNSSPLYDGLMKDISTDGVSYRLPSGESADLTYTITAYLDTSVTSEYANKSLTADFKWWLEDVSEGHGGGIVKPTDPDKDKPGEDEDDSKDQDDEDKDKPSKDDKKDQGKDNTKGDKDNKTSGKKGSTPKTGDSSDLFLWIGLAALTGGGSIFLLAKKRQKGDEEND